MKNSLDEILHGVFERKPLLEKIKQKEFSQVVIWKPISEIFSIENEKTFLFMTHKDKIYQYEYPIPRIVAGNLKVKGFHDTRIVGIFVMETVKYVSVDRFEYFSEVF